MLAHRLTPNHPKPPLSPCLPTMQPNTPSPHPPSPPPHTGRRCLKLSCQQQCPHIAAFARLAVARFCLQHASAPPQQPSQPGRLSSGAAIISDHSHPSGSVPASCAGALHVQAALRDACVLHHAAALAAAAPHAAPAAAASTAQQQPGRPRAGELYNPSSVLGPETKGSLRASARACAQVAGTAHLLQAAAWHAYGAAGLAVAHVLVHLACYGSEAGGGSGDGGGGRGRCSQDAAAAWAQLVTLALEQQGGWVTHDE